MKQIYIGNASLFRLLVVPTIVATLSACNTLDAYETNDPSKANVSQHEVVQNYISLAQQKYNDALVTAEALEKTVNQFLAEPTDARLGDARSAWIQARVPYQQTEVYRFGNEAVDDWEGKVNAWPLDEGLIDYVDASYGSESDENPFFTANIIANPMIKLGGDTIDVRIIDTNLLANTLHELDEVESNVATGYHAVEFLLWGQDLNGTAPGAGARPASDYSVTACTGGNCERRRAYLSAATNLIVKDLKDMTESWQVGGEAYQQLIAKGDAGGLSTMLTGMGSLAYGELAGERIKLGLMLNDPEEEHDCFSDNTHWSHYYDAKGISNIYRGEYLSTQGTLTKGASLSQLIAQSNPALDAKMLAALATTERAMQAMVDEAAKGNTFDVLIGENNLEGHQIIQTIVDSLVAQTRVTEELIVALGLENLELEGSDSLDAPDSIEK